MESFRVAILGCGTVGGGVAKILLEQREELSRRAGKNIELAKILDLFPTQAAKRHGIPAESFCGDKDELTSEEASSYIDEILEDEGIDLVVETIGGSNPFILGLAKDVLGHKKHLATANKALLAEHGKEIFDASLQNERSVGFEAAVCGAIPIIRGINECFAGDEILSLSGIMNGTSNYILSKMEASGQSFEEALEGAQEQGYAEADPSLDINGGDAGHKLTILLRLVFGLDIRFDELHIQGIEEIASDDITFATEMDCRIKLICFAKKIGDDVFATVRPMLVKKSNLLSNINNATNAVRLLNRYSQENVLIGEGAGCLETGSAIVSDIVFIAKHGTQSAPPFRPKGASFRSFNDLAFPYNIVFETEDIPGTTGIITTAIGKQNININTVSHNQHNSDKAIFAIATMPCNHNQIQEAIKDIRAQHPDCLLKDPTVTPILSGE